MPFQEKRLVNPTVLTTSASSALYTVPTGYTAIIKQLVVTNTTASPRTFTIYIGATAVAGNALFSGTAIAASDALVINLSQVLASTEKIFALSDAGSALNLTISGVENNGPLEAVATYIADNAVTTAKIADASVTTAKIADASVTTEKIAAGAIIDVDVNASAAIAPTKIAGTSVVKTDYTAKGVALIGSGVSTPTALTVGTNGQLLTANSATTTGVEWQNNTGGLQRVTPTSVSGATAGSGLSSHVVTFTNSNIVDINGVFNSTYRHYRVMYDIASTLTSAAALRMQLMSAGTPIGSNYVSKTMWTDVNLGSSAFQNNEPLTIAFSVGALGTVSDGALSGSADILNPAIAASTQCNVHASGLQQGVAFYLHLGGGFQRTASAYDGLRVFANTGNMTGQIRIYGYA